MDGRTELESLRQQVAVLLARVAELEAEIERLKRRGYKPQPNRKPPPPGGEKPDRRRRPHRQHRGSTRPPLSPEQLPPEQIQRQEAALDACPCCGGRDLIATGEFDEHVVVDIPEPRPEYQVFRRPKYRCGGCGQVSQGRSDLDLPGARVGPRARLLTAYARAHLGISLGKTCDLLGQWWGVPLSRAGALGHLKWAASLFEPVVVGLLKLLRQAGLLHADETGWRINGKNVWVWCFSNPQIAVYLIDHSRGRKVLEAALGQSLPGVLVCDFYAAYDGLAAAKQRGLTHLLRTLRELREKVPARCRQRRLEPLLGLFQDAIALAKRRSELTPEAFRRECDAIYLRFGALATAPSRNTDVRRIQKRLHRYVDELFVFLERADVPPDNNAAERDIRSVAAARSDGGVNRTAWGARAFAHAKTVVRTCQKQGLRFLDYGLSLVRALRAGLPAPLPLAPDTS